MIAKTGPKLNKYCLRGHNQDIHRYYKPDGRSGGCKVCRALINKKWETEKRLKDPDWQKKKRLKADWGLTLEEYQEMLNQQNNKCAICGSTDLKGKQRAIDHNHTTGKIRGILCNNCNNGLGRFKDNINFLQNAIKYLKDR